MQCKCNYYSTLELMPYDANELKQWRIVWPKFLRKSLLKNTENQSGFLHHSHSFHLTYPHTLSSGSSLNSLFPPTNSYRKQYEVPETILCIVLWLYPCKFPGHRWQRLASPGQCHFLLQLIWGDYFIQPPLQLLLEVHNWILTLGIVELFQA